MTSPLWLPFGVIILAWGIQLTARGIVRTRRSGMGHRAVIYGRIIPGAVGTLIFAAPLGVLCVAAGVSAVTCWAGTPLLLCTMWGVAALVGGWLRLQDLRVEAANEADDADQPFADGFAGPSWEQSQPY